MSSNAHVIHSLSPRSDRLRIEEPDCRGGATTTIVARTANGSSGTRPTPELSWQKMQGDQNLIYLTQRLQTYAETLTTRLDRLGRALDDGDAVALAEIAHALTETTARLGAVRMMKLCIALQMQGRRELLVPARKTFEELEQEFERFKETLISYR